MEKIKKFFGSKKGQKLLATLKKTVLFFLVLTFAVYILVLGRFLPNRPYPAAKVLMSAAFTVNVLYVMPLNKLGYKNPLTWPFYAVRNVFYNAGMHFIPKDDGEREMWWAGIRYREYDEIIRPAIRKYYPDWKKDKEYSKRKARLFEKWTNEVYSHIEPMATLKIKDEVFKGERYGLLIDVIYEYNKGRGHYIAVMDGFNTGKPGVYSIRTKEMERYKHILDTFQKSQEYVKEHEPKGWDHFYNETKRYHYDDIIRYQIARDFLEYEYYNNRLTCSSPYIELYCETKAAIGQRVNDANLPKRERARRFHNENYGT